MCDMSDGVVFFPEALWDPKAWLVIVIVGIRLFVALSVRGVSLGLSVVMPVGTDVCVEDV